MDGFGASKTQLDAAKIIVENKGQYIEQLIKNVEQTAVELTSADWAGPASRAFGNVMVGWRDEMGIMRQMLTDIAEKLGMNANVYQAVDEDARAATSSIQGLINR
ncbi:WXG100 family type VII secretion target [Sinosporangium album]|uniref:WXG100 family type VII secretion target n=1 Tax=Sinosporangium album TaxID=504805 RepID=A0A1G7YWW8_9ACTN|nr:WXG100 family type VII secretion target [Sinosporangium album]SDH01008.1 WXG100 family type VII secretion target [Sinosporangium album]